MAILARGAAAAIAASFFAFDFSHDECYKHSDDYRGSRDDYYYFYRTHIATPLFKKPFFVS